MREIHRYTQIIDISSENRLVMASNGGGKVIIKKCTVFYASILRLEGYTGPGKTWTNEMNFVMNHAPGARSIARPVNQQSSALTLYHECPQVITNKVA